MTRPARQGEGEPLVFTIPGPPVPKARARVVAGHAFTPTRTGDYEKHVAIMATVAKSRAPSWRMADVYAVTIDVFRRGGLGDADNYAKAVCDACNGILWADDRLVRDLHVRIHDVRTTGGLPRAEVSVRAIGASS